jgi:hypothetical protein
MIEPAPGAARETKSSFQAGYVGFDTGPEVFQLAVHPAALDHGIDCEGTLLVEGDILDAQGLCLLQIVEAGVPAIADRLSRRCALARDVALATSAGEIEVRRRAFIRKWRLKCKAVADSLEEAGDRLFTFTRLPISQWKECAYHQRNRTAPRGFQTSDQDPDSAALRPRPQPCCSGAARRWADHHAQCRQMADADIQARRRAD